MPKHTDYVTDISHPEDVPYLKTPLFNVNLRLFRSSDRYRALIIAACDHISWCCLTKADGYKLPHGFSGANAGIPWNIIAKAQQRGTPRANAYVMINPKITGRSRRMVETMSNCGSIRLPEPIKVLRHEWIVCDWYDVDGVFHQAGRFGATDGGFTIQHEIDHNAGILITDRAAPTS